MAKLKIPPTRKEVAEKCKIKRQKLGLSMRDVAKILFISPSTYSRVESAKPMRLETYASVVSWLLQSNDL